MTKLWIIRIECKLQQIWGVIYQCEEYACMLYEIWILAYFSPSVKYWYEIGKVLVPIFHVLWGIGTNSLQCEIHEVWNLRFNKPLCQTVWIQIKTDCLFDKKWFGPLYQGSRAVFFFKSGCISLFEDCLFWLFDLILYVASTLFQLSRDGSSWVEPVLS